MFNLIQGFDTYIFNAVWPLSQAFSFIKVLVVFFGNYLAYLTVVIFLIQLVRLRDRLKIIKTSIFILLAEIINRGLVTETIRFFFYRQRPFEYFHLTPLFDHVVEASFPSGHAVFFFTLAFCLWFSKEKKAFSYFLMATLISLGRVMAGVHWFSDIAFGAIIAFGGTLLVNYFLNPELFKKIAKPVLKP